MGHVSFIFLLYVDDMLVAAKNMDVINELKQSLSRVRVKDLGGAKKILSMNISRDGEKGLLWLS